MNINSPVVCSQMKLGNLLKFNAAFSPMWGHKTNKEGTEQIGVTEGGTDPNWIQQDQSVYLENLPGKCRYDPYRAMIDPNTACLCVATIETCTKGRQGCYWHEDPETNYRECISKAEKFYNLLYALLSKRGKKSFAINIRYGATPARGYLPYGPWGPAVIGYGNPSPSQQVGLFRKSYGGGYKRPHRPQPPPPYGYQQSLGQDYKSPASYQQSYQQGHAADPNFKGDTKADEAGSTGGRQEHSAGPAGTVSMNDLLGAAGTLAASTGSMGMYGESVGGYGNMGGMTTGMNGAMGGSSGGMTGGYGSMGSGTGAMGGMTGGYGSMGEMTGAMGGMSGAMGGMSGGYGSMGGMSGAMGGMSGGYGSMVGMSGAMGGMSGAMGGM